jgi:hypothetical protein
MAVKFNNRFNINNVVKRLVYTILALYVGGTIINTFATVMTGTSSPFYSGLSLIGWTVNSTNHITATSSTGVLAVVGIIGIASIVTEFITW